jgi:hypothetical protein
MENRKLTTLNTRKILEATEKAKAGLLDKLNANVK